MMCWSMVDCEKPKPFPEDILRRSVLNSSYPDYFLKPTSKVLSPSFGALQHFMLYVQGPLEPTKPVLWFRWLPKPICLHFSSSSLFFLCVCVLRQGFSVALEPVLELALVDRAGFELTKILLSLPPKCWD